MTENISLADSAINSLFSAMSKPVLDTDLTDFTVTCGDMGWKVHSTVLALRSPFFKAAITNIITEKLEMKIEVKDLDPKTMGEVFNFMYGFPIGKSPIKFLLKAAERFKMDDLRADVVKLAKKRMNVDNVVEFGQLAEMYNIGHLIRDCAEYIVKNDVEMKEQDMYPKLATLVLSNLKDVNRKLKDANGKLRDANGKLKDANGKLKDTNDNVLQELEATKQKLKASEIELQNYKGKRLWDRVWQ